MPAKTLDPALTGVDVGTEEPFGHGGADHEGEGNQFI